MSGEKKLKLKSSDNQVIEVDELVVFESQMLKDLIEDMGTEIIIPVPEVKARMLAIIIEYCKYRVGLQRSSDEKPTVSKDDITSEIKDWEAAFIKKHELNCVMNIRELIAATNYLNIKTMLNFACQIVADGITSLMLKHGINSAEAIRTYWEIKNDFDEGEEEEIKRENQWVFE